MGTGGTLGRSLMPVFRARNCSVKLLPVAKPWADPPDRKMPSSLSVTWPGASASVSRAPGAPPRTSTAPTLPSGKTNRLVPVAGNWLWAWPANMPFTSWISLRGPGWWLCCQSILLILAHFIQGVRKVNDAQWLRHGALCWSVSGSVCSIVTRSSRYSLPG